MQISEEKLIKIVAGEGKLLKSKTTHMEQLDDGSEIEVPDAIGHIIYLGSHDSVDNYIEIEDTNESEE